MASKALTLIALFCLAAIVVSLQETKRRSYLHGQKGAVLPYGLVDPTNCFFDGQRTCYSCKNAALCVDTSGGMTAYDEPCYHYGEVCNIEAEAVEAQCMESPANDEPGAECFCNPSLQQPRTEPDPYTVHAYLYCDNGYTNYFTCYDNYVYNADFDDCTPVPPTCQNIGIFPFDDECDYYYICEVVGQPGLVEKCATGTFFDQNVGHCNDIPEQGISCTEDDGTLVTGTVSSPVYCSYYYVCDNGTFVSTENCAPGYIFNEDDKECIPDDGSCITTGYCF